MADNYLEKRMEDYRRGTAARRTGPRRGYASFPYPHLTVLLSDLPLDTARALAAIFTASACTVLHFGPDNDLQGCGVRLYAAADGPEAMAADLSRRGESIDVVVTGTESPVAAPKTIYINPAEDRVPAVAGDDAAQIALMVLALAHPANRTAQLIHV